LWSCSEQRNAKIHPPLGITTKSDFVFTQPGPNADMGREKMMQRSNVSVRRTDRPHCALMLAARITLPHFSVSSAMNLPKSAGEPASTVAPKSASRALIVGSASPALISLLSLSMISVGVFLGAPTPKKPLASRNRSYRSRREDHLHPRTGRSNIIDVKDAVATRDAFQL
jgi:hypothetical protein